MGTNEERFCPEDCCRCAGRRRSRHQTKAPRFFFNRVFLCNVSGLIRSGWRRQRQRETYVLDMLVLICYIVFILLLANLYIPQKDDSSRRSVGGYLFLGFSRVCCRVMQYMFVPELLFTDVSFQRSQSLVLCMSCGRWFM